MKSINKKYLLGFSLLTCLITGSLLANPIMSLIFPSYSNLGFLRSIDYLVMGRDLLLYTHEASLIIVGEVVEVNDPYLPNDYGLTSLQNIKIDIKEVLKGNPNMQSVNIVIKGGEAVGKNLDGTTRIVPIEEEDGGKFLRLKGETIAGPVSENEITFKQGEKILLFVGTIASGDYVAFAGPYGKYLIDKDENVTSIGDFKMSLKELKSKIQENLKIPAKKYTPPSPIWLNN